MLRSALFGLILSALAAAPAIGQEIPCVATVERAWSDAGLDRSDVDETFVTDRYHFDAENEYLIGYDIWTRFKSCKGALVVDITDSCYLRQVYTRGECRLPGVPSF
ncbi:MAG: hypothetical protein ACREDZ_10335 [Kiloniellales bacterium]